MAQQAVRGVVVGIGNPILSDDGVGWRVADQVEALLHARPGPPARSAIEVLRVCAGGLTLAEALIGYERAVIVDAILTPDHAPGTVVELGTGDLPATLNTASAHDLSLVGALRLLRRFGAKLPTDDRICVVAIAAEDVWTFAQHCTGRVDRCVPLAARTVIAALDRLETVSSQIVRQS